MEVDLPKMAPGMMNSELSRYSEPLRYFMAVAAALLMLLGLLGNLLTIWVLYKNPKVQKSATAFIISLCTSDSVFCLVILPFDSLRFIDPSWTKVRFLCVLLPLLEYGHIGISLQLISMITINRFILITHHSIYYEVYKKQWIALMIFFCVLSIYGPLLPIFLGVWGKFDFDNKIGTCSIIPDENGRTPKTILCVLSFVIPCIVIVCCYTKIFWVVHGSETRMQEHLTLTITSPQSLRRDTRQIMRTRRDWKVAKMILVVFLSFVSCYLPTAIVKFADPAVRYLGFHVLGYLLLYFSPCVNPLIYVLMNKQYRQTYAGVICCSRIRASLTPHGSSAPGHNNCSRETTEAT